MTDLFDFTIHHDNAGVNAIFALTFCAAAIYLFSFVYDRLITGQWHDASRIMFGFSVMCVGVATRIGFWIPWRAFLVNGDIERANWYRDFSWAWTWGGAVLALAGLLIIMLPSMRRLFGPYTWLFVVGCPALFYLIGVLSAEYLV